MFETYTLDDGRRRCATHSLKIANQFVAAGAADRRPMALFNAERCNSPVRDLPTAKTPTPTFCGDVDGFAVSFGADEVIVFPTWDAGAAAIKAAREAQAELAACLANKPERA